MKSSTFWKPVLKPSKKCLTTRLKKKNPWDKVVSYIKKCWTSHYLFLNYLLLVISTRFLPLTIFQNFKVEQKFPNKDNLRVRLGDSNLDTWLDNLTKKWYDICMSFWYFWLFLWHFFAPTYSSKCTLIQNGMIICRTYNSSHNWGIYI